MDRWLRALFSFSPPMVARIVEADQRIAGQQRGSVPLFCSSSLPALADHRHSWPVAIMATVSD